MNLSRRVARLEGAAPVVDDAAPMDFGKLTVPELQRLRDVLDRHREGQQLTAPDEQFLIAMWTKGGGNSDD